MKKTFESFAHCAELREVVFLRTLPNHPHLVPTLDIFLDPLSKKLHIAMEYMDGNLYQLMKAREHKQFDGSSVKSILFQIMSGLEHIHDNNFFHRDIKPENILVSTSAPDSGNAFKRYSSMVTPPSTPPAYTIKIADFGLARETHSRVPYTTYVSTRWYRAPEVLLRAGEYSAPVDIWAIGAMAVEIATLKPLFPGGNEVDQVWRVCEFMGSPGDWVNKLGERVGGGEWRDGVRLAQKLGFSFPKMAPHPMDTILQSPQWPASLAHFVTSCLMWDPENRPTSTEALRHEYFSDAVDPLRPKSTPSSRLLGRKQSELGGLPKDAPEQMQTLSSKTSSWFRKSLIARESAPAVPQHIVAAHTVSPRPSLTHAHTVDFTVMPKVRLGAHKSTTWTHSGPSSGAPIPILPTIKPVSPLSDAVTAQASAPRNDGEEKVVQKIGRQLSVASRGNHYADAHRQEAEKALNGQGGVASPTSNQKESFFSHLRKRARRISGRHQAPPSPNSADVEASAARLPWSNRQSMAIDPVTIANQASNPSMDSNFAELDKALQSVRYSLDASTQLNGGVNEPKRAYRVPSNPMLKRHHSLPYDPDGRSDSQTPSSPANAPVSSRTRRAVRQAPNPSHRYDTPDEEDELLDEAIASAHSAVQRLDRKAQENAATKLNNHTSAESTRPQILQVTSDPGLCLPYLTPSPSANRNSVAFGQLDFTPSKPVDIVKTRTQLDSSSLWPTPPYEENEWAAAAAASIFAAQAAYR
ncbi:hypothetical protein LTR04_007124 [Oleoguttula sp. CCFEE 6159]|nr:hypothetical protein LTR04_007124 [Oleoguttula sp. CCFEE 6159]